MWRRQTERARKSLWKKAKTSRRVRWPAEKTPMPVRLNQEMVRKRGFEPRCSEERQPLKLRRSEADLFPFGCSRSLTAPFPGIRCAALYMSGPLYVARLGRMTCRLSRRVRRPASRGADGG